MATLTRVKEGQGGLENITQKRKRKKFMGHEKEGRSKTRKLSEQKKKERESKKSSNR